MKGRGTWMPVDTTERREVGRIWSWDSVPAGGQSLLDDYRLLQYDVLLGERYALGKVRTGAPR
jgi:hypothetical protein